MKILIVDDNRVLTKALVASVPWKENGVEVADIAFNGKEAVRKLDAGIDVLVTDVRMPHMNGLELTRLAAERFPDMQVIFLSAYNEFEYAVEALKLSVSDYITKPVDNDRLLAAVLKAGRRKQSQAEFDFLLAKSLPYMREHILIRLLFGDSGSLHTELQQNFPDWRPETYFTCITFALPQTDAEAPSLQVWELKEQVEHMFPGMATTVIHYNLLVLVLSCDEEPEESLSRLWLDSAGHIIKLYREAGQNVTVGVSHTEQGEASLKALYQQTLCALGQRFTLGRGDVFVCPAVSETSVFEADSQAARDALLCSDGLYQLEDEACLQERLEKLSDHLCHIENRELFTITAYNVLSEYVRNLMDCASDMDGLCAECLETYERIFTSTREESVCMLKSFIKRLNGSQYSQLRTESREIIQEIYAAIEKVGFDPDGGLKSIAQQVYLSPSYVSTLFKQETGQNISQQLGQLRLSKARKLLRESNYRVYEISRLVGYPNQYYFSVWFKKNTGVTPSEYRESFEK